MQLAKDVIDVGLSTNNLEPMLRFWQQDAAVRFDHMLPVRRGQKQYRHDEQGSVIKLNHHAELCLSKIKCGHIGGAARRELGGKVSARRVRRYARRAHPSARRDVCGRHYNMSCTTAAGDGGATRRTRQRGRGIPVGSNRSAVRHTRFAMETAKTSADRECLLIELVG